jgi:hypothetical protein
MSMVLNNTFRSKVIGKSQIFRLVLILKRNYQSDLLTDKSTLKLKLIRILCYTFEYEQRGEEKRV